LKALTISFTSMPPYEVKTSAELTLATSIVQSEMTMTFDFKSVILTFENLDLKSSIAFLVK
jgi:hypothetical protein